MAIKIGNKVRNIHSNLEGVMVFSTSGGSVSGVKFDENGNKGRFHTLGQPLHLYEADWKRVYKFKYNMKEE